MANTKAAPTPEPAFRVVPTTKFISNADRDALKAASEWLDAMASDGWEPVSPVLVGTTGSLALSSTREGSMLLMRRTDLGKKATKP